MMSEKTILVWFRNDLRIHDNEILFEAAKKADKVLPVYCFDPFYFKTTELGLRKTGNIRARFLLLSLPAADVVKGNHYISSFTARTRVPPFHIGPPPDSDTPILRQSCHGLLQVALSPTNSRRF